MLMTTVKVGDEISVHDTAGNQMVIRVHEVKGDKVRLAFDAEMLEFKIQKIKKPEVT